MIRRIVFASVSVIALSVAANAADMNRAPEGTGGYKDSDVPAASWTGCYLGANIGGAGFTKENILLFIPSSPESQGTHSGDGVIGGGQLGCDYQFRRFVLGVQGSFDGTSLSGGNTHSPVLRYDTNIGWLATLTGRVGITLTPDWLVYGKGGAAWASEKSKQEFPLGTVFASEQVTRSGWTYGGGAEYRINHRWSAFAEYQHLEFNDRDTFYAGHNILGGPGLREKLSMDVGMLGVNYRLGAADPFALVAATSAADMNVPGGYKDAVTPLWSGFYAGPNIGFTNTQPGFLYSGPPLAGPVGQPGFAAIGSGSFSSTELSAGGQIGYIYRLGAFVIGAEADIVGENFSKTVTKFGVPPGFVTLTSHTSASSDWTATFRGRLGVPAGPALFYVTGGAALTDLKFSQTNSFGGLVGSESITLNKTRSGYVIGGGVEYALTPSWSVKAEYLHMDFGHESGSEVVSGLGTNTHTIKLEEDSLHLGLNYHFLPSYTPLNYVPGGYKDTYIPDAWSGFYIGANGGWGWNAHNDVYATTDSGGLQPEGGFGGGQIGYNWQSGHLVFGVEADIQGSGISDKRPVVGGAVNLNSDLDWFGTARGRLGYASGPLLLYATGGFAYGGIRNEVNFPAPANIFFKDHDTATGLVVGGGYEHKFSPAWSIKTEYQFIGLGRNDPIALGVVNLCLPGVFKCRDDEFHTVRAGLNYHFGSGYEPLN